MRNHGKEEGVGSFKIDRSFLIIFLWVSVLTGILVGTSICCARVSTMPAKKPFATICDFGPIKSQGVQLKVPGFVQRCKWCWATDVAMIGSYYTRDAIRPCDLVTQTTTVAIVSTSTTHPAISYPDCCVPEACDTTCDHGGTDEQIRKAFKLTGYEHEVSYNATQWFSETDLQWELSNNRPVMIVVQSTKRDSNGEYQSHVRVVYGFTPLDDTPTRYYVIDSNDRDPFERNYWQLIYGDDYYWIATWTLTATAAPECKGKP